jgi:hypothetical protein
MAPMVASHGSLCMKPDADCQRPRHEITATLTTCGGAHPCSSLLRPASGRKRKHTQHMMSRLCSILAGQKCKEQNSCIRALSGETCHTKSSDDHMLQQRQLLLITCFSRDSSSCVSPPARSPFALCLFEYCYEVLPPKSVDVA